MDRSRASETERAYWRRLGEANERLEPEHPPASSLREVFARMERIRERLGPLAEAGLAPDEDAALEELRAIRERFLRRGR